MILLLGNKPFRVTILPILFLGQTYQESLRPQRNHQESGGRSSV